MWISLNHKDPQPQQEVYLETPLLTVLHQFTELFGSAQNGEGVARAERMCIGRVHFRSMIASQQYDVEVIDALNVANRLLCAEIRRSQRYAIKTQLLPLD